MDEYRLYRSVIDTPLSVPEDQVMQNAAEEYGVTIQDANLIVEKVMLVLASHPSSQHQQTSARYIDS